MTGQGYAGLKRGLDHKNSSTDGAQVAGGTQRREAQTGSRLDRPCSQAVLSLEAWCHLHVSKQCSVTEAGRGASPGETKRWSEKRFQNQACLRSRYQVHDLV